MCIVALIGITFNDVVIL